MTPQILRKMYTFLNVSNLEDTTLCLFMFFFMPRKSNMVPVSAAEFYPEKQLLRRDVSFNPCHAVK